jgi:hypothetical protein
VPPVEVKRQTRQQRSDEILSFARTPCGEIQLLIYFADDGGFGRPSFHNVLGLRFGYRASGGVLVRLRLIAGGSKGSRMRKCLLKMGAAVAMMLPAAACTTRLEVDPLPVGQSPAPGTFFYVLPKTAFQISGTVTLTECSTVDVGKKGAYRPALNISEVISVTPVLEADPDAQYSIPYDRLTTWAKETNFTITTNANKTVSGVNATINDQAGPVVLQGLLAAVKIAGGFGVGSVAGVAAHAAGGGVTFQSKHIKKQQQAIPAPPPEYCTPVVAAALKDIDQANTDIYAAATKDAVAKVTVASPNIAKLQTTIARAQSDAKLIRQFSFIWSPGFSSINPANPALFLQSIDLYQMFIREWLSNPSGRAWFENSVNKDQPGYAAVHAPIEVRLTLKDWTMGGFTQVGGVESARVPLATGLVLRDPALGTLRLCRDACVLGSGPVETTADLAAPVPVSVPQLGRYMVLPLKNQLFENSNLTVALNADGTISSIGNHALGTLATNLGVAGQVGDAVGAATTARNAATTSQNTAAVSSAQFADTVNKALADCLTQQAAVRTAGGRAIGTCQ